MCPACKQPMVLFQFEGVEIDHCLSCGGTWLDAGELEQLTEIADVRPGDLSRALREAPALRKSSRRCPRCRRKLRVIRVGEDAPVELDRCPKGHGLWFDRGEMQSVVASFAEGEAGAVASFFGELFKSNLEGTSFPNGG